MIKICLTNHHEIYLDSLCQTQILSLDFFHILMLDLTWDRTTS